MTNDERIEKMEQAMALLDNAGLLLIEATRAHLKESYKIAFDNLVDKHGKTIEIELTNFEGHYQPICVELMEVGRQARKDAERIKNAFGRGQESADTLIEMFDGESPCS